MSVFKQLAIHNFSVAFGLPVELSHEIMGFCFYDSITAASRAKHKANMAEIVDQFDNAISSRALEQFHDMDEQWAICLARVTRYGIENEVQLEASNCQICGNYNYCHTFHPPEEEMWEELYNELVWLEEIPIRMRCYCHL